MGIGPSPEVVMVRVVLAAAGWAAAGATSPARGQPENDQCESATAISGFVDLRVDTRGASTDGPAIACGAGQVYRDVWYCWTAERTGAARMALCVGSGDSVLAVYDGCARPGPESELACNDDACSMQSMVTFRAEAGRSYLVRAGGWSDAEVYDGWLSVTSGLPGVLVGPVLSPVNGHEYWLLESSSWTEAESAAVEMGGHLATVRNAAENDWLMGLLDGGDVYYTGWLGLTDAGSPGDYRWASGEPSAFRRWAPGEPDHAEGLEFWVQMRGGSGEWSDAQDRALLAGAIVEIVPLSPCDFNGDGFVDFFDYDAFVACFEGSGCPERRTADFSGDGFVDFFDYDLFVQLFEAGCG